MQYSQEHLKTMVYAEFGGQTECIMGNWKIENKWGTMSFTAVSDIKHVTSDVKNVFGFWVFLRRQSKSKGSPSS